MEQLQKIAAFVASSDRPVMRFNSKCTAYGYPQHSGKDVLVYADPIYGEGVFRVVAKDGWEGLAFPDDLSIETHDECGGTTGAPLPGWLR